VFVLPDGRTLAEVAAEEKNRLSHRAAAMRALVARLRGDAAR
jgi:XTP/dITP diphosphohydrolase